MLLHGTLTKAGALAHMQKLETLSTYRKFAEECDRLAEMAETERHREILERMAEAWRTLAEEESS
jgi:hypothetical protein